MKKPEKRQFELGSRARNKMFEARELRVTVPAFGPFDVDGFTDFLSTLSAENSPQIKVIKQWALGDRNQNGPPHETITPVEPLSEDWYRLNAARQIEEIEMLIAKMNFSAEHQPSVDALIAHCINLGRTHSRAEAQRKYLPRVEIATSVIDGGRSAGKAKRGKQDPDTPRRLEKMKEFRANGATVSGAARTLNSQDPSHSIDANRQLYNRDQKTKK